MGRKKSSGPNLHVCGKDGAQREVYKLKEEHEEKDWNRKRKGKKKNINRKEESESREKELHWSQKKTFIVLTSDLERT